MIGGMGGGVGDTAPPGYPFVPRIAIVIPPRRILSRESARHSSKVRPRRQPMAAYERLPDMGMPKGALPWTRSPSGSSW